MSQDGWKIPVATLNSIITHSLFKIHELVRYVWPSMTQDNFILPAPPVGGLPISQDWLNGTKLVPIIRTIPIILPSGKNITVDTMSKIIIGYTSLGMRQIPCRLGSRERERNVLFNDALNTFYLRLYGVRHMVKDHSDSEKGNPLPPHRLLLLINSKGSFICTIPQTG